MKAPSLCHGRIGKAFDIWHLLLQGCQDQGVNSHPLEGCLKTSHILINDLKRVHLELPSSQVTFAELKKSWIVPWS
jgi:hypothetical protein